MNTDPFTSSRSKVFSAPPETEFAKKANKEIDLGQVAGTLWRGKVQVLLAILLCMALCAAYMIWIAVPHYRAHAVVTLEARNEQVVDFQNVLSGLGSDLTTLNTEVEVMRARGLIGRLVERLDLEADPEFNEHLRPETIWSGKGMRKAILTVLGLYRPEPAPTERQIRDDTIDLVLEGLRIDNVQQSRVFWLEAESEDPDKAALIADTLAELYVQEQLDVKFQATDRATAWLAEKVGDLEIELEVAENAVKDFSKSIELISPETLAMRNRQLKDFRDRLADARAQNLALNQRVTSLREAEASDDPAVMVRIAFDKALGDAFNRLSAGGTEARAAFDARFADLLGQADFQLQRTQDQIITLSASIADLERRVTAQSAELLRLEQLEREATASRLIYEYFLGRLKETSVQRGIQQADSRILSRAVIPDESASPRYVLLLIGAAVIGFALGGAVVLIRELRSSAFRTPEDLEQATGVAVIGQIPRAPYRRRTRILDYTPTRPTPALVEGVRNLRTSILLTNLEEPPQLIMLSSSVPGEGKTTQALALAHNLAGMNKKVLLIEGDIRRRTFNEYFGANDGKGLLAAVAGEASLAEAVTKSDELGADVLQAEPSNMNAADFFSSAGFRGFLTKTRKSYDFIVIDTPPVLAVPDARVIAKMSDVVLYVVHWDQTSRRQVLQGLRSFATVGVEVTGLVLSQLDMRGMQRYGYGDNTYSDYYNN